MQLVLVGDAILNFDRITILDFDRTQTGAVLRVHGDSSQPIMELTVPIQTAQAIVNLVPQNMRFAGTDASNT